MLPSEDGPGGDQADLETLLVLPENSGISEISGIFQDTIRLHCHQGIFPREGTFISTCPHLLPNHSITTLPSDLETHLRTSRWAAGVVIDQDMIRTRGWPRLIVISKAQSLANKLLSPRLNHSTFLPLPPLLPQILKIRTLHDKHLKDFLQNTINHTHHKKKDADGWLSYDCCSNFKNIF